jgi:hypothetical protein
VIAGVAGGLGGKTGRRSRSKGAALFQRLIVVVAALFFLSPGGATGLAQSTDKNPLASVKSLKCRFPVYTVGSWKNGEPKADVKQAQQLSLEIDEIDTEGGTARVTATSGPTHVTALLTISSLHFMERTVTGTLTITTVFASEGNVRTFRAVHSRHDYLPMSLPGYVSEPSVSQSYGECEAPAAPSR